MRGSELKNTIGNIVDSITMLATTDMDKSVQSNISFGMLFGRPGTPEIAANVAAPANTYNGFQPS